MNNLDRRFFLKGAGVCLALPYMPSLTGQTKGGQNGAPKRMVFVDISLGLESGAFFPKDTGKNCKLSPTLSPLADHKDNFTVLSNVEHIGVTGGHRAQHALLSGVLVSDAGKYPEGNVTVDMKATEHVGAQTRFPSLHMGFGSGNNRMSWTRNGNSVPMMTKLEDIFRKLFVDDSKNIKQQKARALTENDSVLDAILAQSKDISKGLDTEDKAKLDEYMTSVRETEKKLQDQKAWVHKPKPKVDKINIPKGSIYANAEEVYALYYDMVLLALKTDSSRIVSLQFPGGGSPAKLPGVSTGYHLLSHHGKDKERLRQLHIVEKYHIQMMANFLTKLQESKEGGTNLLERTSVFMGAAMGNASSHSNRRLPALVAGGGFKHQGHLKIPKLTQLSNLYVTLLQNFGMEIDKFGPSNGTISI